MFSGFFHKTDLEMGPPGRGQHIGEAEASLMAVPWPRIGYEAACGLEVTNEPQDHQAIGPIGEQRGAGRRLFRPTLGISRTQEFFGLMMGYFDAGACLAPSDDLMGLGCKVSVHEHGIRVRPGEIMAQQ
jgi:hypothetical protein